MTIAHFAKGGPDWVELLPGVDVVNGDEESGFYTASYATILMWSAEERAAWGIAEIIESEIPTGKIATGSTLVDYAGEPRRIWSLEDAPPPPVASEISDRQFAQILAMVGTITQQEAIAWAARGDLPAALQNAVAMLPEEQRFPAEMLLSSATIYERNHPMVPMLAAILNYNSEQLDDLWRAAAQL